MPTDLTSNNVARRDEGDRVYLELVLQDLVSGGVSEESIFELEVPDLTVADVSVAYNFVGQIENGSTLGHGPSDYYGMTAVRKTFAGEDVLMHELFEDDTRALPEEWRLVGPMRVRVRAFCNGATGATPNVAYKLLAGVVVSPAVPMCAEEWEKRKNAVRMNPIKTWRSS